MKLNITNKTNVPYEVIGRVYDKYLKSINAGDTIYENKVEYQLFDYKRKDYKMKIEFKVSCICILVEEYDILAKEVSMKGVGFPRLPKKEVK